MGGINLKIRNITIVCLIFFISIGAFTYVNGQDSNLQPSLAKKIIRFHVVADNDSEVAQEFKLKVRDNTLEYMKTLFTGEEDVEVARGIILDNLETIEDVASNTAKEEGFDYNITAKLCEEYFPVKEYGSVVFPQGNYEALKIEIGAAKGKNWWCVMYPNLCFVEGTYAVIDEETKEEIKRILTDDEYKMLMEGSKTKVKFKFLEFLN